MQHMTEDGILYNIEDVYCVECGDIYPPTATYCDNTVGTFRCKGALVSVEKLFS